MTKANEVSGDIKDVIIEYDHDLEAFRSELDEERYQEQHVLESELAQHVLDSELAQYRLDGS